MARLPKLGRLRSLGVEYDRIEARDVEDAVAAALVVRATAFRQVGGFSDRYFFFLEDSDLCRRIGAAGYRIRHFTDASTVHLVGASISSTRRRKNLYLEGLITYGELHFTPWQRLLLRPMIWGRRARMRLARESATP